MNPQPTTETTAATWGGIAIAFHWLLAVLIVGQFVIGTIAEDMPVSPRKLDLFVWHKSIGVTVFLLVILRIAWRLLHGRPAPPAADAGWERRAAQLGHGLLYLLMVVVPATGWWASDTSRIPFRAFWRVPVPDFFEANRDMSELAGEVHEFLTTLFMVVVAMHVLAAFRHHFVLRNDTLIRMLPGSGRR